MSDYTIPAGTTIGHVHLKVADLDRAESFYRDVLGFEVQQHYDNSASFLSAGGYHHHIGLNIWQSRGGSPPTPGTTGLFHLAVLYPTRSDLARAVKQLVEHGVPIDGASDHGVSEAIYLRDPDRCNQTSKSPPTGLETASGRQRRRDLLDAGAGRRIVPGWWSGVFWHVGTVWSYATVFAAAGGRMNALVKPN
jgi:catechol 2,3-dioxygenase